MNRPHINTTKKPAFTMIELVFVIVILGILAAIAIPKISANRLDARIVAIKQDIGTFTQALSAVAFSRGAFFADKDALNSPDGILAGFNDISMISKENWRTRVTSQHVNSDRKHIVGIYSTLSTKGRYTNDWDESCVEIDIRYSHGLDGSRIKALVVEIKESLICQRIGPAGRTEYPLVGKDVKF